MRRVLRLLPVAAVLMAGAMLAGAGRTAQAGGVASGGAAGADGGKAKPADCKTDADCVLVKADCCGCAGGGKQKTLPAKDKAAWERDQKKTCAGVMCTAVMSTDPSCNAKAVCNAGACQLKPAS